MIKKIHLREHMTIRNSLNNIPAFAATFGSVALTSIWFAAIKSKNQVKESLKACCQERIRIEETIKRCQEEIFMGRAEQRPDLIKFSQEKGAKIINLSFQLAETKIKEMELRYSHSVLYNLSDCIFKIHLKAMKEILRSLSFHPINTDKRFDFESRF